eukprot:Em0008g605a
MLERLAAWFLNTYVAEYVGNLVTHQLTIGLLQGAVELENLLLKKDALKKLNLPIEVKFGYIGKLKLQIPVRYIKSQPWVVEINELFILVGPAANVKHDPKEEETQAQASKQAVLEQLEKDWRADQQLEKKSQGWFWTSFSGSFTSNVIANLQVVVNDVHIRYEDAEADPAQPFSIGVRLERVSVESADENWEPRFVSGQDMARKLVDFKNFSVYWDTELLGSVDGAGLVEALREKHMMVCSQSDPMTSSTFEGLRTHTLMVRPVSAQLRLTRNCSSSPLRLVDGPRFHFDVSMEEVPVSLTQGQYAMLVKLLHVFGLRLKARRFLKWRPDTPVKESPRLWWRFAASCIYHTIKERNRRHTWSYALQRARQNVSYVAGYSSTLAQQPLAEVIKEELKVIEREQSVEDLCVLRKMAMARIKKQKDLVKAAQKLSSEPQSSWIPAWLYGYGRKPSPQSTSADTPPPPPPPSIEENKLLPLLDGSPSEEEEELLDEMSEAPTSDTIMRDRILATVSFRLKQGSFELVRSSLTDGVLDADSLLELRFDSLCCSADIRPRLRYSYYNLSLGSLVVSDPLSQEDCAFGFLIQPKVALGNCQSGQLQEDSPDASPLFSFSLVLEEIKCQRHVNITVHTKPLDIVYNRSTIGRVQNFFSTPLPRGNLKDKLQLQGLRNTLGELFESEDRRSRAVLSVMLDIAAPHIIVPRDFDDKNTSLVIFDLGHVMFTNVTDWSTPQPITLLADDSVENVEDDDTFMTPPSSPPPEDYLAVGAVEGAGSMEWAGLVESFSTDAVDGVSSPLFRSSVAMERGRTPAMDSYERYQLWLSDLQVLVGKVGENWGEVLTSGHTHLHVLDKFTLSMKIQRMKENTSLGASVGGSKETTPPSCGDALLTLSANLPALMFHIDEDKVQTMISCLKPPRVSKEAEELFGQSEEGTMSPGFHDGNVEASIYQSAYTDTSSTKKQQQPDMSLYKSTQYSLDDEITRGSPLQSMLGRERVPGVVQGSVTSDLLKERHRRRMSVANEKLLSARLNIDAVCLSLSSRGCMVVELNVPGVSVEAMKRPFDAAMKLHVQDVRLVDRMQTFGPTYETVLCASGRGGDDPASPTTDKSSSPPTSRATESAGLGGGGVMGGAPTIQRLESTSTDVFSMTSCDLDSLLVLTYSYHSPNSPRHPAMRDLGEDEYVVPEREASIRKVNVRCTAMEAIANQQTIVELISFVQRALPREMFEQQRRDAVATDHARSSVETSLQSTTTSSMVTEMKLEWDRLDILIVRRRRWRTKKASPGPLSDHQVTVGAQQVGRVTLVGLGVQAWFRSDTQIQGKLSGIGVHDLSSPSNKYRNIFSMGTEGFVQKTAPNVVEVGNLTMGHSDDLSFSIQRSFQPQTSLSGPQYRIFVSVSMPSIYYTHSVDFIYEMEAFVSDFKFYSGQLSESLRKAAVGMARGLVGPKSHLAEGLDKLSFLGPAKTSLSLDDEGEADVADGAEPVPIENQLLYDISIQSPVIVVPSSLSGEDTLIAHLGEISLRNEFTSNCDDLSSLCPGIPRVPQTERIALKVTNMSLHASHDGESREWLVSTTTTLSSTGRRGMLSRPGRWSKVLKETSVELRIDRCIWKVESEEGKGGEEGEEAVRPDVILVGKIIDPVLVKLPKEVFDHIQKILKHGLRKSKTAEPSMPVSV